MLQLAAAIATLANLNLRVERMGKDKTRPAADLKFTADVPNTVLDDISPGLLASLYRRPDEKGHQADLTAADPTAMTTPRHPKAKPWQSTEDWPGYFATIQVGEFDAQTVELQGTTLKGITAAPKNGGTVELSFTVSGHPTGDDVSVLYDLMGKEATLTLQPPALGDLERLRTEAKAAKTAAPDDAGDDAGDDDGSGPITDEQAGRAFPSAIDGRAPGRKAGASTLRSVDTTPALDAMDRPPTAAVN